MTFRVLRPRLGMFGANKFGKDDGFIKIGLQTVMVQKLKNEANHAQGLG